MTMAYPGLLDLYTYLVVVPMYCFDHRKACISSNRSMRDGSVIEVPNSFTHLQSTTEATVLRFAIFMLPLPSPYLLPCRVPEAVLSIRY